MKITSIKSHVLGYDLDEELGYSQQYYSRRSAHLVEVTTDEGLVGWGECFGPGTIALANKAIVEKVIQPLILGRDPLDREVLWHFVYNRLRDHGQKGMPLQALSGVDIALWDIAGKAVGLPLHKLLGGASRDSLPVYGYGMMLRRQPNLAAVFAEEAAAIKAAGFTATKMKVGLGPAEDIKLVEAVRRAIGDDMRLMVDANHGYDTKDAMTVGRALGDLGVYWFEEPVAPEDRAGYRLLRDRLDVSIAGGEAEFTRWGWRDLLAAGCLDIAQPEVCGLGGISEYLKVVTLCQTHFIPVMNHVWGSAVSLAANLQLLAWLPDMPGGLHPAQPLFELDTTPNRFTEELLIEPLDIKGQVAAAGGMVAIPQGPGLGVTPDMDFIRRYEVADSGF